MQELTTRLPAVCDRHNYVHATYVDAAIVVQHRLGLLRAEQDLPKGIRLSVLAQVLHEAGGCRAPLTARNLPPAW